MEFDFESISANREFIEVIEGFKAYIDEEDTLEAIRKINEARVLCALNAGKYGIHNFNNIIQNYLKRKGWLDPAGNFYHNQPIIVTRNDYTLGLFNGDVGLVRKDENGELKAWFESTDKEGMKVARAVSTGYLPDCKTVFAMTIHKSQGSEFERVVIVLPDKENLPILTRELLYTGVTRAKKHALVIGRHEVIEAAVKKNVSRASGIRQRIEQKK